MKIQKKVVEELAKSFDESFQLIYEELTNDRTVVSEWSTSDLMDIDKIHLDKQIDGLLSITKKLKALKQYNHRKPL